jgi:hypothetical protein
MRASGLPPSGQENEVVTTHASMMYGMNAQPTGNDQPAAEIVKVGVNASSLSKASDASSNSQALASVSQLFRYASWLDIFCMVLGIIASGVTGASQPVMMILFGDMITGGKRTRHPNPFTLHPQPYTLSPQPHTLNQERARFWGGTALTPSG